MAVDPISAIGLGLQAGQGIGSAVKGHQASNQLSQNMGQTNQLFNQLVSGGLGALSGVGNAVNSFADPNVSQFLQPAIPTTTGPDKNPYILTEGAPNQLTNQSGSGNKGSNTAGGTSTPQTLSQTILGNTVTGSQDLAGVLQGGATALGNQGLANQAAGLLGQGGIGGLLAGINQAGGLTGFQPGQVYNPTTNAGSVANGQIQQPTGVNLSDIHTGQQFTPDQFAFNPVQATRQQALDFATDAGNRARATAQEQSALALNAGSEAVDKMLASRGLSANSGVGAAALGQLASQQGQQMVDLNRDLANQAQQAALQGSQFDVSSLLDLTGLGSQYNLGINQLTGQLGLGRDELIARQLTSQDQLRAQLGIAGDDLLARQFMAQNQLGTQAGLAADELMARQLMQNSQLQNQFGIANNQLLAGLSEAGLANNLARSNQLAALQGLQNQTTLARTDLLGRSITDPLSLLQGVYQQNYLNPQLQALGLQSGLAGQLIGSGVQGLLGNQAAMAQAVQSAGAGKGAATAGVTNPTKGSGGGGKNAPVPEGPQLFSVGV